MATKLRFNLLGDPINAPVLYVAEDGLYEAPNSYQLPHRFYYDPVVDKVKDKYAGKTDSQVQEIDHDAAVAKAIEEGMTPPPPLPSN